MVLPVSVSPLVVQEYPSVVRGLPSAEAGAVEAEARTPAPGLVVQGLAVSAWGYRLAPVLA